MSNAVDKPVLDLEDKLREVQELIKRENRVKLVSKRELPSGESEDLPLLEIGVHRQFHTAMHRCLAPLRPSEIAALLEMLPSSERMDIWTEIDAEIAGQVLIELPINAAKGLAEETERERLVLMLSWLPVDQLAYAADVVDADVITEVKATLQADEQAWLSRSLEFPEDSVGSLMKRDSVMMPEHLSIDEAIRRIRQLPEMPIQTDKLFVVDAYMRLLGVLQVTRLLRGNGDTLLRDIMDPQVRTFAAEQSAAEAGQAFELYDLVSAPVIDEKRRVIGRLTVETVMDYLRERSENEALLRRGLSADTDLFGPIFASAKERWLWLAINLATAFVASRFIALFQGTIEQLVALATLMPIIASIGGNTGNQTVALMIRGLSLNQVQRSNVTFLVGKEVIVSLINGLLWGSVLGGFAWLLYRQLDLSLVLMAATTLNLIIAALVGVLVPLTLNRLDVDPAMGSSVILTFTTDSMGFLIFLGLATLVLV